MNSTVVQVHLEIDVDTNEADNEIFTVTCW